MDILPDSTTPAMSFDNLTSVLDHLDREFSRPVMALREALTRLDATDGGRLDLVRTLSTLCDDLLDLPGDFRDYLQLARGSTRPEPGLLRLSKLRDEIDHRLAPMAASCPQDWLCTLEGEDADVSADPATCVGLLFHLAENALRYAPAGASTRVSIEKLGETWRMTVADTGPGIPESERERMLLPFTRLARDMKLEIAGAGLGLAFCRAAVDRLGGTITFDAPPGLGLRVIVELPCEPH